MSEGPIPDTEDRSIGGCHSRMLEDELFGCLSRLPSNRFGPQGSGENFFYYVQGKLSLHSDAFWVEECRGYVSASGYSHVQGLDQENSGSLH